MSQRNPQRRTVSRIKVNAAAEQQLHLRNAFAAAQVRDHQPARRPLVQWVRHSEREDGVRTAAGV